MPDFIMSFYFADTEAVMDTSSVQQAENQEPEPKRAKTEFHTSQEPSTSSGIKEMDIDDPIPSTSNDHSIQNEQNQVPSTSSLNGKVELDSGVTKQGYGRSLKRGLELKTVYESPESKKKSIQFQAAKIPFKIYNKYAGAESHFEFFLKFLNRKASAPLMKDIEESFFSSLKDLLTDLAREFGDKYFVMSVVSDDLKPRMSGEIWNFTQKPEDQIAFYQNYLESIMTSKQSLKADSSFKVFIWVFCDKRMSEAQKKAESDVKNIKNHGVNDAEGVKTMRAALAHEKEEKAKAVEIAMANDSSLISIANFGRISYDDTSSESETESENSADYTSDESSERDDPIQDPDYQFGHDDEDDESEQEFVNQVMRGQDNQQNHDEPVNEQMDVNETLEVTSESNETISDSIQPNNEPIEPDNEPNAEPIESENEPNDDIETIDLDSECQSDDEKVDDSAIMKQPSEEDIKRDQFEKMKADNEVLEKALFELPKGNKFSSLCLPISVIQATACLLFKSGGIWREIKTKLNHEHEERVREGEEMMYAEYQRISNDTVDGRKYLLDKKHTLKDALPVFEKAYNICITVHSNTTGKFTFLSLEKKYSFTNTIKYNFSGEDRIVYRTKGGINTKKNLVRLFQTVSTDPDTGEKIGHIQPFQYYKQYTARYGKFFWI